MANHDDEMELAHSVDSLARSRFWLEMVRLSDELVREMEDTPLTKWELSGFILKLANMTLLDRRHTAPISRPEGPPRLFCKVRTGLVMCAKERPCPEHEPALL